jgi:DNA-directed RNA polymerase sigma subunit (sigma70/sigma32)
MISRRFGMSKKSDAEERIERVREEMGEEKWSEMSRDVRKVLKTLSPKEEERLRKRFGIMRP